jgi:xylulokinase
MGNYLLGIDVGGTGIKAGLFSPSGKLLHLGHRDNYILSKRPGFAELSPSFIWKNIISLIDECCLNSGIKKTMIDSVGISSTCPGLVAMDKNGVPLRDIIMNFDSRSSRQAEKFMKKIGEDYIFEVTGNRFLSGAITASSILWIKEKEPDIYEKTFCFGHITTYIIYRLTGKFVLDHTQASFTGLFRTRKDPGWDVKLIRELDIDRSKLPELLPPEKAAGSITEKATLETGFSRKISIASGAADTVCSALGAGIIKPGEIFVSSGTSEILSGILEVPDFEKRFLNRTYLGGNWIYHAPISTAGAAISWLKKIFFRDNVSQDHFYKKLTEAASKAKPGSGGIYFLPYLQGERSPWWDSKAKGVLAGLSLSTSAGDIFRSVLEGIGFALKQNIDIAEKNRGCSYGEILFTGGGSRNKLWLQIKSDILGKVLKVMDFKETAIRGSALLGGMCSGRYRNSYDAVENTCMGDFSFIRPDMESHKDYSLKLERFESLYLALKSEFRKM